MCKKTIDRRRTVQSITWFPGGEGQSPLALIWPIPNLVYVWLAFMAVEGSCVTKLVSQSCAGIPEISDVFYRILMAKSVHMTGVHDRAYVSNTRAGFGYISLRANDVT